jgi:hypothetical protein
MKSLTIIEVDVPSFDDASPIGEETFRFAVDVSYLPPELEAIPSLKSVSLSPFTISLGGNLGQRATLTCSFGDHRHVMNGESFDSGSFWGKWRARYGLKLRGRNLRWITGLEGQALEDMETRHFVIESTEGPTLDGTYQIIAKDVLKLADNDRAQAPVLSNGFLVTGINDSTTTATLSPAGIGNSEYPASGYVAIGGEEICAFTRSADTLTITRGQLGTVAVEHDAQDRVQLCIRYVAEDPADIIADLLENYAGVDPAYIPLTSWQNETGSFLQRVYTTTIAEPTGVNALVSELIEQAALAMWWDDLNQVIRLQVLRPIASNAASYSPENTLQSSVTVKEQPNTRLSQVWTYFGQRNPLRPVDEPDNYRSSAITTDEDAELDYGGAAIKKIFSRWIPPFGRSVATKLNTLILGRFVDPPRRFTFDIWRYSETENPILGTGYQFSAWFIQDVDGQTVATPVQITRLNPMADKFQCEAEELLFDEANQGDLTNRVIIIDSNVNDVDLRDIHDTLYPDVTGSESPPVSITCIIQAGVIVGSTSVFTPAFDVGDWPVGVTVNVTVQGRIQGRGGVGADGSTFSFFTAFIGGQGGPALVTDFPINLDYTDGEIWGGAGGGAGGKSGAGGGGAGQLPGAGGSFQPTEGDPVQAQSGTTEVGGQSNADGGDGGDPGEYGFPGAGSKTIGLAPTGGFPGPAILGMDLITITGSPEGDERGGRYEHMRSVNCTPGDGSSMAIPLPRQIEAGDLLMMFITNQRGDVEDESDDISLTTPSGWTQLYHTTGPGYCRRATCYYKVATGSEGTTQTVSANRSCSWGTVTYAVRGYTGTPEAATTTGTSAAPNAPNLTPSWGSDEVLLITVSHHIGSDLQEDNQPPIAPSGYTDNNLGTQFISATTRVATVSAENPGAWTYVNSDSWVATTVALRTA